MKPCDITKVEPLLNLLTAPAADRDDSWLEKFYVTVVDASFRCETPQIFTGPDGFPYFSLLSPEPMKAFDSFCICNLAEPATDSGFGIAINRRADGVDWVFSCGDLLSLRLTGTLKPAPAQAEPPKTVVLKKDEAVFCGAPSESYLPTYTRRVIRHFMQQALGINEPQVFLMHLLNDPVPMQLVFSTFREQFASDDDYYGVLKALSWYLPRNYSITGIPMSSDMREHFVAL